MQNEPPPSTQNQEMQKQEKTSFPKCNNVPAEKTENYIKNEHLWNMLKKKDTQAIRDIINPFTDKESQAKVIKPSSTASESNIIKTNSRLAPNIIKTNAVQRTTDKSVRNSVTNAEVKSSKNLETTPATELLNAIMQNPKLTSSVNNEAKHERTFYNSMFVKSFKDQSTSNAEESAQDTSDALRKILRINSDDGKSELLSSYQNYTKVDVENLPKPPPTWRNTTHSNDTFAGNRQSIMSTNLLNQSIQNTQPVNANFSLSNSLNFNSQNVPMSNHPLLHPQMPTFSGPPPPHHPLYQSHPHPQTHPLSYPPLPHCVVQPQPQSRNMPIFQSPAYNMPMDYSRSMSMPHPHANYAPNFSQVSNQIHFKIVNTLNLIIRLGVLPITCPETKWTTTFEQ